MDRSVRWFSLVYSDLEVRIPIFAPVRCANFREGGPRFNLPQAAVSLREAGVSAKSQACFWELCLEVSFELNRCMKFQEGPVAG